MYIVLLWEQDYSLRSGIIIIIGKQNCKNRSVLELEGAMSSHLHFIANSNLRPGACRDLSQTAGQILNIHLGVRKMGGGLTF